MISETDAAIHSEEANPSVALISVKQPTDNRRLEKTHISKQIADVKASDSEPKIHAVLPQTVSEQPTPMNVKTADPRTGRTTVCNEVPGRKHSSCPDTSKVTSQKEEIKQGEKGPGHSSSHNTSKVTSQKEKIKQGVKGPGHSSSHNTSKVTSQKEEIKQGVKGQEHSSSPDTSKVTSQKEEIKQGEKEAPVESSRKSSTFVLPESMSAQGTWMLCEECGANLADTAKFCPECGTKVKEQPKLSKEMECKDDLRILLVGHTGHGKSATGNSLLGITREEGFYDETSRSSVTDQYKRLVQHRFGRRVEVVDTPGIFDSSLNDGSVIKEIATCVGLTLPGFNAICLVLKPERFSMEIVKTVDIFLKFFGKGIDEYAFVILTYMASEAEMNKYINGGDQKPDDMGQKAFHELRKRCKGKILFIDNSRYKNRKEEMVWNILTAVDEANAKALKPYFQNKLTRQIQQRATEFYLTQVCGNGSERAKKDLRILLLGLPGHGKSATGNSLLGEILFPEKATKEAKEKAEVNILTKNGKNAGRKIQIVEFPVKDPLRVSKIDLREQLLQAERMLKPGFHALCFVIDPNKISDLKDQFQRIMEYFGDEVNDYAFVIITFTKSEDDLEKNFPSIIEDKHAELTSVLKFCNSKELYIDNKVSQTEKEEMIKDIFSSIDSSNVKKFIPHFSSRFKQDTEAAEALRAAEELRAAEAAAAAAAVRASKAAEDAFKAAEAAKTAEAKKAAEIANARAEANKAVAEAAVQAAKDQIVNMAKAVEDERKAFEDRWRALEDERKETQRREAEAFEAFKKDLERSAEEDKARKAEEVKEKYKRKLKDAELKANSDLSKAIDAERRIASAEVRAAEAEARLKAKEESGCTVM